MCRSSHQHACGTVSLLLLLLLLPSRPKPRGVCAMYNTVVNTTARGAFLNCARVSMFCVYIYIYRILPRWRMNSEHNVIIFLKYIYIVWPYGATTFVPAAAAKFTQPERNIFHYTYMAYTFLYVYTYTYIYARWRDTRTHVNVHFSRAAMRWPCRAHVRTIGKNARACVRLCAGSTKFSSILQMRVCVALCSFGVWRNNARNVVHYLVCCAGGLDCAQHLCIHIYIYTHIYKEYIYIRFYADE